MSSQPSLVPGFVQVAGEVADRRGVGAMGLLRRSGHLHEPVGSQVCALTWRAAAHSTAGSRAGGSAFTSLLAMHGAPKAAPATSLHSVKHL